MYYAVALWTWGGAGSRRWARDFAAIGAIVPLRASSADESIGLDMCMHGEEAYVQTDGSSATVG